MSLDIDKLRRAETGEAGFSRLEATLVSTEVVPRPNSRQMNDVYRHTHAADLQLQNELDLDYTLDTGDYPLTNLSSLQQVFDAVQYRKHLEKCENFSLQTEIECLQVTHTRADWRTLDDAGLQDLIQSGTPVQHADGQEVPPPTVGTNVDDMPKGRLLLFLVPLIPTKDTSFGSRTQMSQSSTRSLYHTFKIHPAFLLNMLGRPDYWAPVHHWDTGQDDRIQAFDFSCQHPRWNLQVQGAPLSVYMRHDVCKNETIYLISHKQNDSSVYGLKKVLDIAMRTSSKSRRPGIFLDDPFDIHVILSTLSFEASKHHVQRFRRFMWTQINKVDDQLASMANRDRAQLSELTKQLQVISQNADSHIGNADVCIITAQGIRDAHARIFQFGGTSTTTTATTIAQPEPEPEPGPAFRHQHVRDSIDYVIDSMAKQKMWFLNYKNRKDSTMSLVYNLVTQQDAVNNIELAADMKRDSTSMSAIAALTMVFLPATFTAAVLDGGIFLSQPGSSRVQVNGIWWFWLVITLPLTLLTIGCWWLYKRKKDAESPTLMNLGVAHRKSTSTTTNTTSGGGGIQGNPPPVRPRSRPRPDPNGFSGFGSFTWSTRYSLGRLGSGPGKME